MGTSKMKTARHLLRYGRIVNLRFRAKNSFWLRLKAFWCYQLIASEKAFCRTDKKKRLLGFSQKGFFVLLSNKSRAVHIQTRIGINLNKLK